MELTREEKRKLAIEWAWHNANSIMRGERVQSPYQAMKSAWYQYGLNPGFRWEWVRVYRISLREFLDFLS